MSVPFAHSIQVGLSFGLTSGVVTTLGLIVGLAAGTQSRLAVVGGIVTIAVADALSDALGIHLAQESTPDVSHAEVWSATLFTFVAKFVTTLSFLTPVLLLPLEQAIVVSVVWGYLIIGILSYLLARSQELNPLAVTAEHIAIATFVVAASHFIGAYVRTTLLV